MTFTQSGKLRSFQRALRPMLPVPLLSCLFTFPPTHWATQASYILPTCQAGCSLWERGLLQGGLFISSNPCSGGLSETFRDSCLRVRTSHIAPWTLEQCEGEGCQPPPGVGNPWIAPGSPQPDYSPQLPWGIGSGTPPDTTICRCSSPSPRGVSAVYS